MCVYISLRPRIKFIFLFSLFFQTFAMKEGVQFRIRIDFIVQREIVTGLKYVQKTSRMAMTGKLDLKKIDDFASPRSHFHICNSFWVSPRNASI